jgi:hypothetical protein
MLPVPKQTHAPSMPADEAERVPTSSPPKKLRSACDACHASKMRCFGGSPCVGCQGSGIECVFSVRNRQGRPKGVRNKHQALKNVCENTSNKSPAGKALAPSTGLPVSNNVILLDESTRTGLDSAMPQTSAGGSERPLDGHFLEDSTLILHSLDTIEMDVLFPELVHEQTDSSYPGPYIQNLPHPLIPSASFTGSSCNLNVDPFDLHIAMQYDSDPREALCTQTTTTIMSAPRTSHDDSPNNSSMAVDQNDWAHTDESPSSLQVQDSCDCLKIVSDLLCRSTGLDRADDPSSLGALLLHTQSAFLTWQALFICLAPGHDDEEVLPLIAVSIGAVVRRLKSAAVSQLSLAESTSNDDRAAHLPDLVSSCCSPSSSTSSYGPQLSIGSYEIVGKERGLVTGILMSQTLRKVRTIMTSLHNRIASSHLNQPYGNAFDPMGEVMDASGYSSTNLEFSHHEHVNSHTKFLFRDLSEKVNKVDRILRKTSLYNQ